MKIIIIIVFGFFMNIINVNAISADSYIVLDQESNNVLIGQNIHEKKLIASTSKIMTAIVALENADIHQTVTIDKSVLKSIGSAIYIEVGEKITLNDLLYGLMLRSGNDAAIAIAVAVSGNMKNFVDLMNEYAKKIGMNNTVFYNSHGLEEQDGSGNLSTAYDMALLTSYAMKNKIFQKIFSTKTYEAKSDRKTYVWQNKNKLLKYEYITGGKTGYTKKAHRTLVTTAYLNKMNLIAVTLNDSNDWEDHITLYKKADNKYQKLTILNKNDFEIIDDTIYAKDELYINNNVSKVIAKEDIKNLKIKYILAKTIPKSNKIGEANIYLHNQLIAKEDIYIKNSEKQNWFKKILNFLF